LATVRELGIGFVAYSPLGRGLLTGTIDEKNAPGQDDVRMQRMPRFVGENLKANLQLLEKVKGVASAKNVAPAQVALAWLLNRGNDVVPIPGTKKRKWLEQNVAAMAVTLGADDRAALDAIGPASGLRYADMRAIDT
jgi:aryl-alcohol dehydrogenase-like predicted oxidoreductase